MFGTITDALTARTPLLTFYEAGNAEMKYNSSQLEKLGISKNLGELPLQNRLHKIISSALEDETRLKMSTKYAICSIKRIRMCLSVVSRSKLYQK